MRQLSNEPPRRVSYGVLTDVYARPMKPPGPGRRLPVIGVLAVAVVACAAPASEPSGAEPGQTISSRPTISASPPPSVPTQPTPAPSIAPPIAWQQLEATGPRAREDHTWTRDADGTTAYLFGGRDGTLVMGDLWAYDLPTDTWSPMEAPGPTPRFGHEAAWVDGIGLVIFAGQSGPNFFSDLWAFDPAAASWRQLPASGDVPVARYGTCAGIGPDGRLWISHGFTSDGTRFADTKAYDFGTATWTDETPGGDLPVNRCLHGCWWTGDGTLALFGGQTTGVTALDDHWVLDLEGWQRVEGGVSPPPRNLYAKARLDGGTLVLGGQGLDGARLGDAWLLRDGDVEATLVEADGDGPPGRSGAEMVVDGSRDRVLLFGGLGDGGVLADVWQLTGDPLAGR